MSPFYSHDLASRSKPLIAIEGLAIGYNDVPLLEDLDFEVQKGDVFCILGGSGCGKSTLMRSIIGLHDPMAGSIDIAGTGAPDLESGDARRFGVTFQQGALFSSMTLVENVLVPLRSHSDYVEEVAFEIAKARLRLVGLGGFENHMPSEISGGMRKRASIARALALDPPLLFFDEPSAGLDPVSSAELDDLILSLSRDMGSTVVIVTHELESIFRIADDCILLDKTSKGIVARGDPKRLRDESNIPLVRAFFCRDPNAGAADFDDTATNMSPRQNAEDDT